MSIFSLIFAESKALFCSNYPSLQSYFLKKMLTYILSAKIV